MRRPRSATSPFGVDEATPFSTAEAVTLICGTSFVICAPSGDIRPGGIGGYFAGDTRLLDALEILIDGTAPHLLCHRVDDGELTSVAAVGDPSRPHLLVIRRLRIDHRLCLDVEIENLEQHAQEVFVEALVTADFADVFDVKRGVEARAGFVASGPSDGALVLSYERDGWRRGLRVECPIPAEILRNGLRFHVGLADGERSSTTITFVPAEPPQEDTPGTALSAIDTGDWRAGAPTLRSSSSDLAATWNRSCADIATLLLSPADAPDRPIVAAGSPWFMALFGRDSLVTSLETLPLGTSLGLGTLAALAARQGTRTVEETEEQPGKILHEVRSGEVVRRADGWGNIYYGSVDATPLFVITLAELWRWGAPVADIAALLPAAEAAAAWMSGPGDLDGDGFIEYRASSSGGLKNQGWKDSDDAIRHPDGSIAEGPIALVEVQGYAVAALRALADLRRAFGTGDPDPLLRRAAELVAAIDDAFWLADEGCYALALDGNKRPVASVSSNAGHLLWAGAAHADRAAHVARRLMADDMFSGTGIRTLASSNPAYNALSYHAGSVWPHDTAIVAAGMYRYGLPSSGNRLATALLDAAAHFGGRLPELFGGFAGARYEHPIPYPTSCAPQAWAAGATILLVGAMLGLAPDVPAGNVSLHPAGPEDLEIELRGIRLGGGILSLRAKGRDVEILEAPPDLDVRVV